MHVPSRGPFLKSPETFRAHFGCHISLYIFATPRFKIIKIRSPLGFSYIKNMFKDQLFKTNGLQFKNWFSGPEKFSGLSRNRLQGPVSRKSRKLFGPEKPFVKLRPAYSVKLVFSYVVKGIKIKITAKFRASKRLRFEDTKRIMSPEMRPKSFGTFEKRAPGLSYSKYG